jgi:WD40-like Beta Propeller Repeat
MKDVRNISWGINGKLAFEAGYEIFVWDGQKVINVSQNEGEDKTPTWSTDGRLAFISTRNGGADVIRNGKANVHVWDGKTLININQTDQDVNFIYWFEDGPLVMVYEEEKKIRTWDGKTVAEVDFAPLCENYPMLFIGSQECGERLKLATIP